MEEFFAGIDNTLNGKFVGVIIGNKETTGLNSNLLSKFRHMTNLRYGEKRELLKSLNLSGNCQCYCIEFGLDELRQQAEEHLRNLKVEKNSRISSSISYEIRQALQSFFEEFLIKNNTNLCNIKFEADDPDIIRYLRAMGLQPCKPDISHKIADCIAHANGKHWNIDGNVKHSPKNFKKDFRMRVLR